MWIEKHYLEEDNDKHGQGWSDKFWLSKSQRIQVVRSYYSCHRIDHNLVIVRFVGGLCKIEAKILQFKGILFPSKRILFLWFSFKFRQNWLFFIFKRLAKLIRFAQTWLVLSYFCLKSLLNGKDPRSSFKACYRNVNHQQKSCSWVKGIEYRPNTMQQKTNKQRKQINKCLIVQWKESRQKLALTHLVRFQSLGIWNKKR